jgi:fucose permease
VTSALFFVLVGTEVGFGGWVFSYGVATNLGSDTVARLLNTVYWGGLTVGRMISIPLAMRIRPQTMLLADIIGSLASLALLLALPAWPPAVWIATFGLGLSLASMFPTTLNFIERRMPMSGGVTSIFLLGGNFGAMLLPWLMGQLFEPVGPHSLLVICEVAMTAALLFFLVINGYSRRHLAHLEEPG